MKLLAAFALALLPAQAVPQATPALAPNSTLYSSGWPPARYQGPGAAVVVMVEPGMIDRMCGAAPAGKVKIACAGDKDGVPIIIVPNPCLFDEAFALILCHEKGHTLGWPGTHGD